MVMTPAEKAAHLEYWQRHGIAAGEKIKPCSFCGHSYYRPCTEAEHVNCQNFVAVQQRAKRVPAP